MSGSGSIGSSGGSLVRLVEETSAFGEILVVEPQPVMSLHFPYNLNTDLVTTTTAGSGAVTHSGQLVSVSSGAATSSSGLLASNKLLEYHPGQGALIRFTAIFGTGTAGNTQEVGAGTGTDGFFFGYNGTSFGVQVRVGSVDTWTAQTSWNRDKMDGTGPSGMTLDPTKGNVFEIRYQWLGFGAIRFYVESDSTGDFVLVHQIDYTNQNTTPSVNNPSFPYRAFSENTTNNTAVVLKVASVGMFIEGNINNSSYTRNALDNEKTLSGSDPETNILTIRNKSTYQSVSNAVQIQPDFLTVAAEGTKTVKFRIYLNATLGGSPSYTDVRTNNSVVDYDTAGTTVSGGILVASITTAKSGNQSVTFADYEFVLSPGATMTITADSSSGTDATVGISWVERFT